MNRILLFFCSVLLVMSGCSHQPPTEQTAVRSINDTALIDRDLLFGNPQKIQGRISPDGKWFSWIAPHEGIQNIWVAPSEDIRQAKVLTNDKGRGIHRHFWAKNSNTILYMQDTGGNENNHIYAIDLNTGAILKLTDIDVSQKAGIEALSVDRPNTILISMNTRDPQLFDLYEADLVTGELKLVLENPGFGAWIVDHQLRPQLAYQNQPDGSLNIVKTDNSNSPPVLTIPAEDALNSEILGFNQSNDAIFYTTSKNRDKSAVFQLELKSGESKLLGENPKADVSATLFHPETKKLLGFSANYLTASWTAIDQSIAKDFSILKEKLQGGFEILSQTNDGNQWVIYADAPQSPATYYLYNREDNSFNKMFDTKPMLAKQPLQPMQALEIPSRDNLKLVSYLTLPPGADADADGIPDQPVPMVLAVHGGPWGRDSYGYDSWHQWLANRGYAVVSVNYRGSTGFGKAFINAAVGEFAGKMHDDLVDAVNWAVDANIAIADQVAIMGGSYGGYATLTGLTFTPDTFACGVDIVGPSSLVTLIESFPEYWKPWLASTWYKFVGNPEIPDERADMLARSPISRIDRIKSPLLIGQGENDPRVTKLESDQIVDAMQKRNLPVTYVNYPDEGHGFVRAENRKSFYAITEGFLAQCLGGRYEEIGDDFSNSSLQVLAGAEYVKGLTQALR